MTCAGVRLGFIESTSAATPATIGAENEVPHADEYPPPLVVVFPTHPGAARSTLFPVFDQEYSASFSSVPLTVRI